MLINQNNSMTDFEILALYSQWSEDYYCAGFLHPSPETVREFRTWLNTRQSVQTVYEIEMLKEFHKQNKSIESHLSTQLDPAGGYYGT